MKNNRTLSLCRWVGGKYSQQKEIINELPSRDDIDLYIEPFIGAGSVFFNLRPKKAIISDTNPELIATYRAIKNSPLELIEKLKSLPNSCPKTFSEQKDLQESDEFHNLKDIDRGARLLYLQNNSFAGIWRVNKSGLYDVSFRNDDTKTNHVRQERILAMHKVLIDANTKILCADFRDVIKYSHSQPEVKKVTFLDPPYYPRSKTSNFTGYTANKFTTDDQIDLRNLALKYKQTNKMLITNSYIDQTIELYADFNQKCIGVPRSVNSDTKKRGKVNDGIFMNY
ncbi:DNA adenine methylase [Photobacterium leiognathi]|uniref:DNA adenine methylase n=1 Tax=Photobacterium leiognathi TaxID=553611 RepID=UPI0029818F56|nr:Dam family site-specific DNA-(adenine-N6)-methyltransferase [Photobacterium leiognathi]